MFQKEEKTSLTLLSCCRKDSNYSTQTFKSIFKKTGKQLITCNGNKMLLHYILSITKYIRYTLVCVYYYNMKMCIKIYKNN